MSSNTPIRYKIQPYNRRVNRQMRRLPTEYRLRIEVAIEALAFNPRPPGSARVVGAAYIYRLRVGRYRVIYHVNDADRTVIIGKVSLRGETTYDDVGNIF